MSSRWLGGPDLKENTCLPDLRRWGMCSAERLGTLATRVGKGLDAVGAIRARTRVPGLVMQGGGRRFRGRLASRQGVGSLTHPAVIPQSAPGAGTALCRAPRRAGRSKRGRVLRTSTPGAQGTGWAWRTRSLPSATRSLPSRRRHVDAQLAPRMREAVERLARLVCLARV